MAILLMQLGLGGLMFVVTVALQAFMLDVIIRGVPLAEKMVKGIFRFAWKPLTTGVVVLAVFCIQIAAIWLWAFLYMGLGCEPLIHLPQALYFATVTFTTLGYGDITLEESCRMLSGIEGANGFVLFGWATAFVFEVVSQIYRKEAGSI